MDGVIESSSVVFAGAHILLAAVIFGLVMLASYIEVAGICFFGRRRQWRITRTVAVTICGHASYGWIGGSLAFGFMAALVLRLEATTIGRSIDVPVLGLALAGAIAALVGILLFEVRVYSGMRACKYANAPRDISPAPAAVTAPPPPA